MHVTSSTEIAAPPEAVWKIVSGIEAARSTISGIKKIEILEPATGPSLVGLKWRETRSWRGRDATEVMWITDAAEPTHYSTRAERAGAIYTSRISLESTGSGTRLTMAFTSRPVTTPAKILWTLTGWMAKNPLRKVMDQDLADIKAAAERAN